MEQVFEFALLVSWYWGSFSLSEAYSDTMPLKYCSTQFSTTVDSKSKSSINLPCFLYFED